MSKMNGYEWILFFHDHHRHRHIHYTYHDIKVGFGIGIGRPLAISSLDTCARNGMTQELSMSQKQFVIIGIEIGTCGTCQALKAIQV